jgi:predicted hydrocarbon binding protein
LETVFGVDKGREMAAELGHLAFVRGIIDFDPMLGIIDMPRRLMPLGMKIRLGLDIFAVVFNRFSDQNVQIGEDRETYQWIISRCAVCWGRKVASPACHLAAGILEESLSWVSNGRQFKVEEISCIAAGDSVCNIAINKKPID